MNDFYFVSLVITALLTGLSAGLFYSYSCSVNLGLGKLADVEYLRAMQEINKAILNPIFFISFMGSIIVLVLATWLSYSGQHVFQFKMLLTATVIYMVGVFGLTVMGNVPLNDALAGFDIGGATANEIAQKRKLFEQPWNKFHAIRTFCSIASFVFTLLSFYKIK
ncbi:anthrone oxygenase family protein [Dyadobacter psychrophilus]|nr:anthrone oxygenase family protein [Dyadobacter psychrophilus]